MTKSEISFPLSGILVNLELYIINYYVEHRIYAVFGIFEFYAIEVTNSEMPVDLVKSS